MEDFLSGWTFIVGMLCAQVLMILSPLVVLVLVLVMLRRRAHGKDETTKPLV